MAGELERLAEWYAAQCNGDWEHHDGVKLVTIDNPGWSLDVSLAGTSIAARTVSTTRLERSEDDWIFWEAKDALFRARCGPRNLIEMLGLFLEFARPTNE